MGAHGRHSALSSDDAVRVTHFRMAFGQTRVIDDLSFDVRRGETFGLLGSNGSGKTTTIRALLGIYAPTAGELLVNGHVFSPRSSCELGYLPEERGLYKKEPVLSTMVYFGVLKGLTRVQARRWSLEYLERVGLSDHSEMRVDRLSGGQQQKVQLGVTIMGEPDLLILDEPVKGFDPMNRRLLMDVIEEQKRRGATIIMVSHDMADVERLCDRILLLKDGRARAYGRVVDVQEQFGATTVVIAHEGVLPDSRLYRVVSSTSGHTEIELAPQTDPGVVLRELVGSNVAVSSFLPGRRSLDSIFVEVYGNKERGNEE